MLAGRECRPLGIAITLSSDYKNGPMSEYRELSKNSSRSAISCAIEVESSASYSRLIEISIIFNAIGLLISSLIGERFIRSRTRELHRRRQLGRGRVSRNVHPSLALNHDSNATMSKFMSSLKKRTGKKCIADPVDVTAHTKAAVL